MKKNIIYISLMAIVAITMQSCLFQEEDIFDKSASERMIEQNKLVVETLVAAPNGWVMEFFPTAGSPGVSFLMKFSENGKVKMASKNPYQITYAEAESIWRVFNGTSVVLTFDAYNPIIHRFSDPLGGDIPGIGLEGDYEFIVQKVDTDVIALRGLKRVTNIMMYRLDEQQDWKNYFVEIENTSLKLLPRINSVFSLNSGDASLTLVRKNSDLHIFNSVIDGDTVIIPFVLFPGGLRFHESLVLNDQKIRSFRLDENATKMNCIDEGVSAEIVKLNPDLFFISMVNTGVPLVFTNNEHSQNLNDILTQINQSMNLKNKSLKQVTFVKDKKAGLSLSVKFGNTSGGGDVTVFYCYDFISNSNGVTVQYTGYPLDVNMKNNAQNAEQLYPGITELKEFLTGNYTAGYVEDNIAPTKLKLTDAQNQNTWIRMDF